MPRKKPAVPIAIRAPLPPRGLRVAQAADYMGATIKLVRKLISTDAVPAVRLGKRDVILKDDLDAFLDSLPRGDSLDDDGF